MEIIKKLNKPYSEEERLNFIVEYNHNLGLEINETQDGLEALGLSEEEKAQKERERLDSLSLTAADVERAIYKVKGMDFEDVIAQLENQGGSMDIDIKALKIELKANNFYRGNPYISQVGALLGFSEEQLDEFFKTNNYEVLIND